MSEPQIAHRCPSCGASIRVRAVFCQHCGETLPEFHSESGDSSPDHVSDKKGRQAKLSGSRSEVSSGKEVPVENVPSDPVPPLVRKQGMQGARNTVNRARAAARDVIEEDLFQGVDKLRHISSVVLDEAAYDPSVRFVLVAAVLFVLFIVLLVVSEMLR